MRKFEKVAVISILQEISVADIDKVSMISVKDRMKIISLKLDNQTLKDNEANEIILKLKTFGILGLHEDRKALVDRYTVELNLFKDEVKSAYEKDELYHQFCAGI